MLYLDFYIAYSLFRLTSLIYAEKLEFEQPAIMEDKQCKQTELFSAMTTGSDYFLSLNDKSKQRYKVKINDIRGYHLYLIKKEELSSDISKFPPVTYPDIVNYFLFSLSPLTKGELKAYKSLESYNQFVSGGVKEVKTKLFGETNLVIGRVSTKCISSFILQKIRASVRYNKKGATKSSKRPHFSINISKSRHLECYTSLNGMWF